MLNKEDFVEDISQDLIDIADWIAATVQDWSHELTQNEITCLNKAVAVILSLNCR